MITYFSALFFIHVHLIILFISMFFQFKNLPLKTAGGLSKHEGHSQLDPSYARVKASCLVQEQAGRLLSQLRLSFGPPKAQALLEIGSGASLAPPQAYELKNQLSCSQGASSSSAAGHLLQPLSSGPPTSFAACAACRSQASRATCYFSETPEHQTQ